ncbi:hypothetical protein MBLNU230_g0467t1 [Neophaeotheca triangularis]
MNIGTDGTSNVFAKAFPNYHGPSPSCRATQLEPRWDRMVPGEPLAFDAEFANYRYVNSIPDGKGHHRLGRVTLVNMKLQTVLDAFVYYRNKPNIQKFLPPLRFCDAVRRTDLISTNGAQPAHLVERWIERLVNGRGIIMHGPTHDRTAFYIVPDVFQNSRIVDTQELFRGFMGYRCPGLANTSRLALNQSIQQAGHCSVEDAVATMRLFLLDRKATLEGRSIAECVAENEELAAATEDTDAATALMAPASNGAGGIDSTTPATRGVDSVLDNSQSSAPRAPADEVREDPAEPSIDAANNLRSEADVTKTSLTPTPNAGRPTPAPENETEEQKVKSDEQSAAEAEENVVLGHDQMFCDTVKHTNMIASGPMTSGHAITPLCGWSFRPREQKRHAHSLSALGEHDCRQSSPEERRSSAE